MKQQGCSLPSESSDRQQLFWTCVEQHVRRVVVELIEQVLDWLMQAHLQAGWNQRTPRRRVFFGVPALRQRWIGRRPGGCGGSRWRPGRLSSFWRAYGTVYGFMRCRWDGGNGCVRTIRWNG